MSFWQKRVAKRGIRGDTGRPINQTQEESSVQPLTVNNENQERKARRAEAASNSRELDALAAEMRAMNLTWQVIAERLGYANGAVARRAALRHESRASNSLESKV